MSWQTAKLGDVCEIVSGATPKTAQKEYWDGDIYWATPKDLSSLNDKIIKRTERQITALGLSSCAAKVLPINSVLFSSRAPIGLVAVNDVAMATNQGFKSFVPHANVLSPDYLYWWIKTNRAYLNGLGVGATFKEVSKSIVERVEIPLPPLAQQQRIAAILDKAAEIKAKREQAIAKLDALTSATFTELFLEDGKWPTQKLMEVCTTTSGGTPKRDVADYYGGAIFWVKSGELDADLVLKTEETLTLEGVKNSSAKVMPPKTVLLAMYGATIGACSMLGVSAATNQAICCITTGEKLLPEFLMHYLKSIKHNLIKLAVGGAQPNINQDIVRNLVVPIPPVSLQKIFLERATAIRQQIVKAEMSLAQIKTTIASLQHQAFTIGFAA